MAWLSTRSGCSVQIALVSSEETTKPIRVTYPPLQDGLRVAPLIWMVTLIACGG